MYIVSEDELTVLPLSAAERAWVSKFQAILMKCPSRLELVTIGGAELEIVDARGAKMSELADGAAARDGIVLATVDSPIVHGVSG